MVKIIILFLLLPIYLLCDSKIITFAPPPTKDAKAVYSQFSPMIRYLEKKLDRKIEFDYNSSYDEILKKIIAGKIDIAYLGYLPYVILESKYSNTSPLVYFKNKEGNTSYTCSLVSFITHNYPIEKTNNTKIALTQALSSCGYLFVDNTLKESNIKIEENKYRYLGRHDKVALNVILGNFKYGGLKTDIAKEYYHLGLKEIKRSTKIPNPILLANSKTLNEETISNIKTIILLAEKEELLKWNITQRYGAKKVNLNEYKDLTELVKSTKIPSKGNF